jgi:hypothetical protein
VREFEWLCVVGFAAAMSNFFICGIAVNARCHFSECASRKSWVVMVGENLPRDADNHDAMKDMKWGDQTWEEIQYTGFLYSVPIRRLRPATRSAVRRVVLKGESSWS